MSEAIKHDSNSVLDFPNREAFQDALLGMRGIHTPQCPRCRSHDGQWRGYKKRKFGFIHQRWCKDCGRWFYGEKYIDYSDKVVTVTTLSDECSAGPDNDIEELRHDKLYFDATMDAYEEACMANMR